MRADALERAAAAAAAAETRLRRERVMLTIQGADSCWRPVFERAVDTHRRAATLQAEAVALFLHHRKLREDSRRGHDRALAATVAVRDDELR